VLGNKGNIESDGDHAINNTGNGNVFEINYNKSSRIIINRTYLYEFCVKFSSIEDISEYSIEITSDIEDKMDYNEISVYKELFSECDHYLDDVESILEEIPNRQRILSLINFKYKRLKGLDEWKHKDELCEKVYQYLIHTVGNDQSSSDIILEDAELAIHALMYYAFVKCKLLDPIPKTKIG
jgi:hypothetical protein